jgi:hypothetical protein
MVQFEDDQRLIPRDDVASTFDHVLLESFRVDLDEIESRIAKTVNDVVERLDMNRLDNVPTAGLHVARYESAGPIVRGKGKLGVAALRAQAIVA